MGSVLFGVDLVVQSGVLVAKVIHCHINPFSLLNQGKQGY